MASFSRPSHWAAASSVDSDSGAHEDEPPHVVSKLRLDDVNVIVDGKPNRIEIAHTRIIEMDRIMVSMTKAYYTNMGIREKGTVTVS